MYSSNIIISLFLLFLVTKSIVGTENSDIKLVECNYCKRYDPTWNSLDTRPIPTWYDDVKIGIFIHWGVFSVPSYHSEWFWADWREGEKDISEYMAKRYRPDFPYQDFAKDFTAEFYDPKEWAKLFKKSGAKYVVLTSKHHEGFTLWPSKYSFGWNANDVGPHRDLVGELAKAVRDEDLIFGLYHSLYEWYHPLYLFDKANNFTTNEFIVKKLLPEMYELVNNYKPSVIWSDGDWETNDTYFQSTEFLAWLYNDSPVKDTVVVNDRWGIGIPCKHGDFYSCQDRYNPKILQKHKWENAMTIDKESWGFRRNANLSSYLTTHELIRTVAETVSCGGNILINIGPSKDGIINPIFEERLIQLGNWLEINGEAIYSTKPWIYQNDTETKDIWYTMKNKNIYAIVLNWPQNNILKLKSLRNVFETDVNVVLLGNEDTKLTYKIGSNYVYIGFPDKALVKNGEAWTIRVSVD